MIDKPSVFKPLKFYCISVATATGISLHWTQHFQFNNQINIDSTLVLLNWMENRGELAFSLAVPVLSGILCIHYISTELLTQNSMNPKGSFVKQSDLSFII